MKKQFALAMLLFAGGIIQNSLAVQIFFRTLTGKTIVADIDLHPGLTTGGDVKDMLFKQSDEYRNMAMGDPRSVRIVAAGTEVHDNDIVDVDLWKSIATIHLVPMPKGG